MTEPHKELEATIRAQAWARGFQWRTVRLLAEAGVKDEQSFMAYEPPSSLAPPVIQIIRDHQFDCRLYAGRLEPSEPIPEHQVVRCLRLGGVFQRANYCFLSLGSRNKEESILCVHRGDVYAEPARHIRPSDIYTGFGRLQCRMMSKTEQNFGVYRRITMDSSEYAPDLTREVFGMEPSNLWKLLSAYVVAFLHDLAPHSRERVTCSNKENACDLTGNFIPADFPFIAFCETQYWGGHVSLGGFFAMLRMITDGFQEDNRATQRLKEAGADEATITEAKSTGLAVGMPLKWAEISKH